MKVYHRATVKALSWLLRLGGRHRPSFGPDPRRVLYLPASALPYHISGYTTRTQAVIRALISAGADVHVLTRPGYPWDRRDRLQDPSGLETSFDGILFEHARHPSKFRPLLQYAIQASNVIARVAADKKAGRIIAPSNHTNAIPALLAARRLNIPFYYEMRGLWELSRASRQPEFEKSAGYRQGLELEGFVARHANKVLCISEPLRHYAREHWAIPESNMELLPNCIDPASIVPDAPGDAEPNSIGYAGSLIVYEGLDILIQAVGMLAGRGVDVRVTIIGDGEARPELEALAGRLGLLDRVSFLGRMSLEAARKSLRRCALVCLPRRRFEVCEIVPPYKLVEAQAMAKPVIAADLPVLREELGGEGQGWFFRPGDPASLADTIALAFSDPVVLAEKGLRAREHAISRRNWDRFARRLVDPSGEPVEVQA